MPSHESETCPAVPVACPNHCSASDTIPRGELPVHLLTCPLQLTRCPFAKYGCVEVGSVPRRQLPAHLDSYARQHVELLVPVVSDLEAKLAQANSAISQRWTVCLQFCFPATSLFFFVTLLLSFFLSANLSY